MEVVYALLLLGVSAAVAVPFAVQGIRNGKQKGKDDKTSQPPIFIDISDESTPLDENAVRQGLKRKETEWHVGKRARTIEEQLDEAGTLKASLNQIISTKFEVGTITYEKFAEPVDTAYNAIVRNAAEFSNRIQNFDGRELSRMRKLMGEDDLYKQDDIPDDIQEARWSAMSSEFDNINELIVSNRRILAEMKKLESELKALSDSEAAEKSMGFAAELDELSSHVQYYKE